MATKMSNRIRILAMCCLLILAGSSVVWAGPPFVTDDPEPVEYKHGEFYIASILNHSNGGTVGTLPHLEFNYGPLPDLHLHLIVPFAHNKPRDESMK